MTRPRNFTALFFPLDLLTLALDAQAVMGMRTAAFASGKTTPREAMLMVSEKVDAMARSQRAAAMAIISGHPERALPAALSTYRRKVRANRRRLSRSFK